MMASKIENLRADFYEVKCLICIFKHYQFYVAKISVTRSGAREHVLRQERWKSNFNVFFENYDRPTKRRICGFVGKLHFQEYQKSGFSLQIIYIHGFIQEYIHSFYVYIYNTYIIYIYIYHNVRTGCCEREAGLQLEGGAE